MGKYDITTIKCPHCREPNTYMGDRLPDFTKVDCFHCGKPLAGRTVNADA